MFAIISLICAAWLISNAFLLDSDNFMSRLYFKYIPFIIGISLLVVSLTNFGIITVNI